MDTDDDGFFGFETGTKSQHSTGSSKHGLHTGTNGQHSTGQSFASRYGLNDGGMGMSQNAVSQGKNKSKHPTGPPNKFKSGGAAKTWQQNSTARRNTSRHPTRFPDFVPSDGVARMTQNVQQDNFVEDDETEIEISLGATKDDTTFKEEKEDFGRGSLFSGIWSKRLNKNNVANADEYDENGDFKSYHEDEDVLEEMMNEEEALMLSNAPLGQEIADVPLPLETSHQQAEAQYSNEHAGMADTAVENEFPDRVVTETKKHLRLNTTTSTMQVQTVQDDEDDEL